jgi:hypothetical protein
MKVMLSITNFKEKVQSQTSQKVTANKGDWYQGKTSLDYQYALN